MSEDTLLNSRPSDRKSALTAAAVRDSAKEFQSNFAHGEEGVKRYVRQYLDRADRFR